MQHIAGEVIFSLERELALLIDLCHALTLLREIECAFRCFEGQEAPYSLTELHVLAYKARRGSTLS